MAEQLAREIPAGHIIAARRWHAIARRMDNDDVLFVLDDGPEVAVVHLTWSHIREGSPVWPSTFVYPTIEAFLVECMERDAADRGDA
jgi:hypothetical protein